MRKKLLGLLFVLFALCLPRASQAQTWQQFYGIVTTPCTGITLTGAGTGVPTYAWCIDSATSSFYYQGTAGWTLIGGGGSNPTFSSIILKGSSTGAITVQGAANSGTYIKTLPTSQGAIGSILTSGGASQEVWLADGATGTILTGAGATVIPVFSASPTISGTLIDQTSIQSSGTTLDDAIATTNGGHFNTLIGAGSIPTCGTGTVTTISTDNAMEITGATSPATVTFHTAFGAKPTCVCNDETSALGACKAVPNSNGQTVVVTTTGTDSFMMICMGH